MELMATMTPVIQVRFSRATERKLHRCWWIGLPANYKNRIEQHRHKRRFWSASAHVLHVRAWVDLRFQATSKIANTFAAS